MLSSVEVVVAVAFIARAPASVKSTVNRNVAGVTYAQFNSPRGSDRFPSQFYSNFAFQADFRLFGELGAGVKLDIFNLTNQQTKISGGTTDNANYGKATSSTNYATGRQLQITALISF